VLVGCAPWNERDARRGAALGISHVARFVAAAPRRRFDAGDTTAAGLESA
jgi:hypothetical protein